jgi:hypothetical protein
VITITEPAAAPEANGNGIGEPQQRGLRQKMSAVATPSGSIEVYPDDGFELVAFGDTDSVLIIGEVPVGNTAE